MATIQEMDFIYDGLPSEYFNVMMCDFDSSSSASSNDEEANLILGKTSMRNTWSLYGVEYTSPLKFPITIAKREGDDKYFSSEEQRAIKKWLCKKRWCKLQVVQDDLSMIEYDCVMTFANMNSVGRRNAGMTFNVTCNSICAWSHEYKNTYKVTTGSLNVKLHIDSDFEECMYPELIITSSVAGTISITNVTENNRVVSVNNCSVGEVITINGTKDIISSSLANRKIVKDWNGNFFRLLDGWNEITITGNCTVVMKYRYMRRVGG
jgi:phage-related protein